MPYKLIKGEFHIFYPDQPRQGPEPDGDTVKFKPDDPTLVRGLPRSGSAGPRLAPRPRPWPAPAHGHNTAAAQPARAMRDLQP